MASHDIMYVRIIIVAVNERRDIITHSEWYPVGMAQGIWVKPSSMQSMQPRHDSRHSDISVPLQPVVSYFTLPSMTDQSLIHVIQPRSAGCSFISRKKEDDDENDEKCCCSFV